MEGTPLTPYERQQLERILAWKAEEPGVLTRTVARMTSGVARLAQKAIPESAIRRALDAGNVTARWLADRNDLLRDARVVELADLRGLDLERLDAMAERVQDWAVGLGVAEGGAAGVLGLPGIVLDVPVLVTLGLRTVHKIGLCYGYELAGELETQYVYAVLSAAGANSIEEKTSALALMSSLQVMFAGHAVRTAVRSEFAKHVGREGSALAIHGLARQLGANLAKRKALAAIPAIGLVINGTANGWWLRDIGRAARHSFQERWLRDQGRQLGP